MPDGRVPGSPDVVNGTAHAEGVDAGRRGQRADRHRHVEAAAVGPHHVREQEGTPLVLDEPDSPAAQAIRQAARGIIAMTPQELPVLQAAPGMAEMPAIGGTPLPVVQVGQNA